MSRSCIVGERFTPQPLNRATLKQLGLTLEETMRYAGKVKFAVQSRGSACDPSKQFRYAIDPTAGRFGGTLVVFVPLCDNAAQRNAYEVYGVYLADGSVAYHYSTHLNR